MPIVAPPADSFAPPPANTASAFVKKRRSSASYAFNWVKKRLREIYREAARGGRSRIGEPAAHLYLILGTFVIDHAYVTEEIDRDDLVALMHCDPKTVTRARHTLERELGDVKLLDGGQGSKKLRFKFLRMLGPVFEQPLDRNACTEARDSGQRVRSQTRPTSDLKSEVPHSNPGHKVRGSPQPRTQSPKFEAADYVPNDLVVATTHASDTTPVNGADDFLGWYSDEYRRWHYGAPAPRISTARRRFVEDLLEQIPFRQLQLMTLLALSMRLRQETLDDNRLYVARSDHSLTVIYEKASVLADDVKVLGLDMYEGSLDELAEAIRTGKQVLASPASEISRRERTAAAVDVLSDLLTEIGD